MHAPPVLCPVDCPVGCRATKRVGGSMLHSGLGLGELGIGPLVGLGLRLRLGIGVGVGFLLRGDRSHSSLVSVHLVIMLSNDLDEDPGEC